MQTAWSRIWTRVTESISYDHNYYITNFPDIYIYIYIYVCVCVCVCVCILEVPYLKFQVGCTIIRRKSGWLRIFTNMPCWRNCFRFISRQYLWERHDYFCSTSRCGQIVEQTGFFSLGLATRLEEGKLWIRNIYTPLKNNWPCVSSCPWRSGWVNLIEPKLFLIEIEIILLLIL